MTQREMDEALELELENEQLKYKKQQECINLKLQCLRGLSNARNSKNEHDYIIAQEDLSIVDGKLKQLGVDPATIILL